MTAEEIMTSPFAFSVLVGSADQAAGMPQCYGLTAALDASRQHEAAVHVAFYTARIREACDYLQALNEWAYHSPTIH